MDTFYVNSLGNCKELYVHIYIFCRVKSYDMKYSYLVQTIFRQIHLTNGCDPNTYDTEELEVIAI